ncbi:MAG: ATP-binding cassette domain-containing protein [Leucobacter sp.]
MTVVGSLPLVSVRGLRVRYRGAKVDAVTDLSLDIAPGEVVALVGESGSGKSTTAGALLGLLQGRAEVQAEKFLIAGADMHHASNSAWRQQRGGVIARIAQDPLAALNPNKRVGAQLAEAVRSADRRERVRAALVDAGLPNTEEIVRRYPHELSGGQRQRVLIALALITEPKLIIADEPTSSIDATTRQLVAEQLSSLVRDRGLALLVITHDLGFAAALSDRVIAMHAGRIVEAASTAEFVAAPESPITKELVQAARELALPSAAPARSVTSLTVEQPAPLLSLDSITVRYGLTPPALEDATLTVAPGETLGIVGESGAGKSTLVRAALGVAPLANGTISFDGVDLATLGREQLRALRRRFQLVQQDPFASLDPRYSVARCIAEPLRAYRVGTRAEQHARVGELLRLVQLPEELAARKPRQLSGGQRQRVAIARALALDPELVYLDEALSALDATVQARLLELLRDIQRARGVSFVLVSHDLGAVASIAHRIAVFRTGHLVEIGGSEQLLASPRDPYTRELVAAARAASISTDPSLTDPHVA